MPTPTASTDPYHFFYSSLHLMMISMQSQVYFMIDGFVWNDDDDLIAIYASPFFPNSTDYRCEQY